MLRYLHKYMVVDHSTTPGKGIFAYALSVENYLLELAVHASHVALDPLAMVCGLQAAQDSCVVAARAMAPFPSCCSRLCVLPCCLLKAVS